LSAQLVTENDGISVTSGEIETVSVGGGLSKIDSMGNSDNEQEDVSNSIGESLGVLNASAVSDDSSIQQIVQSYTISPDSLALNWIMDTPASALFDMQRRPITVAVTADDDD
jgi:hypothetical protein